MVAGRARTLLKHQNRAPARQQCNRERVKGPPERGTVIVWPPAGRRARRQQSQPRRQLRGRRTADEPPKRLGNRLVGNADALGDEAVRVAKVTKPGGVWRDPAVRRSGLNAAKDELPANASAGANAIVAGPRQRDCEASRRGPPYGRQGSALVPLAVTGGWLVGEAVTRGGSMSSWSRSTLERGNRNALRFRSFCLPLSGRVTPRIRAPSRRGRGRVRWPDSPRRLAR